MITELVESNYINRCLDISTRIEQMYLKCTGLKYVDDFDKLNSFSNLIYNIDLKLIDSIGHRTNKNSLNESICDYIKDCCKKIHHIKYEYRGNKEL